MFCSLGHFSNSLLQGDKRKTCFQVWRLSQPSLAPNLFLHRDLPKYIYHLDGCSLSTQTNLMTFLKIKNIISAKKLEFWVQIISPTSELVLMANLLSTGSNLLSIEAFIGMRAKAQFLPLSPSFSHSLILLASSRLGNVEKKWRRIGREQERIFHWKLASHSLGLTDA